MKLEISIQEERNSKAFIANLSHLDNQMFNKGMVIELKHNHITVREKTFVDWLRRLLHWGGPLSPQDEAVQLAVAKYLTVNQIYLRRERQLDRRLSKYTHVLENQTEIIRSIAIAAFADDRLLISKEGEQITCSSGILGQLPPNFNSRHWNAHLLDNFLIYQRQGRVSLEKFSLKERLDLFVFAKSISRTTLIIDLQRSLANAVTVKNRDELLPLIFQVLLDGIYQKESYASMEKLLYHLRFSSYLTKKKFALQVEAMREGPNKLFLKGWSLYHEVEVTDDKKNTVKLLRQVPQNALAKVLLAQAYINRKDQGGYRVLNAVKLSQEAKEEGVSDAYALLSICYLNGYGVDKNSQKAFDLLKEGADRFENPSILNNLGVFYNSYSHDIFCSEPTRHLHEAKKCWRAAIQSFGAPKSKFNLANATPDMQIERRAQLFFEAAEQGHEDALGQLRHIDGELWKKARDSLFYVERRAIKGDVNSQYKLAKVLAYHKMDSLSDEWRRKAEALISQQK